MVWASVNTGDRAGLSDPTHAQEPIRTPVLPVFSVDDDNKDDTTTTTTKLLSSFVYYQDLFIIMTEMLFFEGLCAGLPDWCPTGRSQLLHWVTQSTGRGQGLGQVESWPTGLQGAHPGPLIVLQRSVCHMT